jgi:CheY-like chemotaxis protein
MAQTVLVADDSVASQRLFEMVLTREGFDVITVGSGVDVLDKVKEKQPDLALIDAVMPGVDGFQVCQTLKQDPQFQNLPVIMLAGTYEEVDRNKGTAIVGANAILEKPAAAQEITSKVKEFLEVQEQVQPDVSPEAAEVVPEPSFVEEEYEFDDDSEEVDLAVESEILDEEAEWEEPIEALDDLSTEIEETAEEVPELEEIEDIEQPAPEPVIAAAEPTPAPTPSIAISEEMLDAVAANVAQRVAAKLGPALLQSFMAYVLQLPSVKQIVDDASENLAQDILPNIQDSLKSRDD